MKQKTAPSTRSRSRLHHHVRMAVVPHEKNRYTPHLIRWRGLVIVALIVVLVQCGYNYFQSGSVLGQATTVSGSQLLDETNQARQAKGLSPLREDSRLDNAAYLKAQDMLRSNYWAHVSPSGVQPWHWFDVAGYRYAAAGENLAKGFSTSSGTMAAWMASPEHRDNILNTNYSDVGFAVVSGELDGAQTTLVVALYGRPAPLGALTIRPMVLGAANTPLSVVGRIGVGIQSMTPALLGSIALLAAVAIVALLAHAYRAKLPAVWRRDWRRHHGMIKAIGAMSIVILLVALYGGGQI